MKVSSTIVRNILGGFVIAAGISFSFADVSATQGCSASLPCGGNPISCACTGSGDCQSDGSTTVTCICDGFPGEECTCSGGCNPIVD